MATADQSIYNDQISRGSRIPAIGDLPANLQGAAELQEALEELTSQPANARAYAVWERTVAAAFGLDGGLRVGSDAQAISIFRSIMRNFLAKFPQAVETISKWADLEWRLNSHQEDPVGFALTVYEDAIAFIPSYVPLWTAIVHTVTTISHDSAFHLQWLRRAIDNVGNNLEAGDIWSRYKEIARATGDMTLICQTFAASAKANNRNAGEDFNNLGAYLKQQPELEIPSELASYQQVDQAYVEAGATAGEDGAVQRTPELRPQVIDILTQKFTIERQNSNAWNHDVWNRRMAFEEMVQQQAIRWDPAGLSPEQQKTLLQYLNFSIDHDSSEFTQALFERFTAIAPQTELIWVSWAEWTKKRTDINSALREYSVSNIYERAAVHNLPIASLQPRLAYAEFELARGEFSNAYIIYQDILDQEPTSLGAITGVINCAKLDSIENVRAVLQELHDRILAAASAAKATGVTDLLPYTLAVEKIAENILFSSGYDDTEAVTRTRALFDGYEPELQSEQDFWRAKVTVECWILTRILRQGDLTKMQACWTAVTSLRDEELRPEHKLNIGKVYAALLRSANLPIPPRQLFEQVSQLEEELQRRQRVVAAETVAIAT